MMNIGVILVLAGIFMAFIYPAMNTKTTEVLLARANVYERGDDRSWKNQKIDLDAFSNPATLKLTANFLPGTPYLEKIVRFRIKISGPQEILLDKPVQISVGKHIGPKDGFIRVSTYVPQFYIPQSASYTINVSMDEKPDFSLSSVFVTALERVEEPDTSMRTLGIVAFTFGLVIIFRREKRKRKQNVTPANTESPKIETPKPTEKPEAKPAKKKIRWGRNADLD